MKRLLLILLLIPAVAGAQIYPPNGGGGSGATDKLVASSQDILTATYSSGLGTLTGNQTSTAIKGTSTSGSVRLYGGDALSTTNGAQIWLNGWAAGVPGSMYLYAGESSGTEAHIGTGHDNSYLGFNIGSSYVLRWKMDGTYGRLIQGYQYGGLICMDQDYEPYRGMVGNQVYDDRSVALGGGHTLDSATGGFIRVHGTGAANAGMIQIRTGAVANSKTVVGLTDSGSVLEIRNSADSAVITANGSGQLTSAGTGSLGWSTQSATDQACNTTCVSACVTGFNVVAGNVTGLPLACTDATADTCICAGAS